ncbi:MAG: 30S ribosomal protein S3 [Chloroflexi bacterium]|nr:30S ribosomal protein S3 [Chloroflexota bacterium]MBU1750913.1 30S ribosomal protein S3 [Chloroflexota bacterium]
MGRKVQPIGFRLGTTTTWRSRWFAEGDDYVNQLHEDLRLRAWLMKELASAGLAQVDIERSGRRINITLHAAKPGMVIGKGGTKVEALRRDLENMTGARVRIDIQEVRQPELNAYLVAQNVAEQIERRISFRRAMRQGVWRAMRSGAEGAKIRCSGRLAGAEMSRSEWQHDGRVPLHTLRADIDYARAEASTTLGQIGVKVWIYKGDVIPEKSAPAEPASA